MLERRLGRCLVGRRSCRGLMGFGGGGGIRANGAVSYDSDAKRTGARPMSLPVLDVTGSRSAHLSSSSPETCPPSRDSCIIHFFAIASHCPTAPLAFLPYPTNHSYSFPSSLPNRCTQCPPPPLPSHNPRSSIPYPYPPSSPQSKPPTNQRW